MTKKKYNKPAIKTVVKPAALQPNSPESQQNPPAITSDSMSVAHGFEFHQLLYFLYNVRYVGG